jgi:hypothetical protein
MERVADLAPVEVGLKTTSRVAEPARAIVCPEQLSFCIENWSALAPPIVIVLIARSTMPPLVMVTVRGELDEPATGEPKSIEEGLIVISGTISM